jgi:hypothetical protein
MTSAIGYRLVQVENPAAVAPQPEITDRTKPAGIMTIPRLTPSRPPLRKLESADRTPSPSRSCTPPLYRYPPRGSLRNTAYPMNTRRDDGPVMPFLVDRGPVDTGEEGMSLDLGGTARNVT